MKTITAIIPVRAGSTRLKNKNVAPVSYTHLDVYKRQASGSLCTWLVPGCIYWGGHTSEESHPDR